MFDKDNVQGANVQDATVTDTNANENINENATPDVTPATKPERKPRVKLQYDKTSADETANTILNNAGKVSYGVFLDAIKANADNPDNVRKAYLANKESFTHTLGKYVTEPVKVKVVKAIREIEPEFTVNIGKRFVGQVNPEVKPEEKTEEQPLDQAV
jgi:hypothetical protein